MTMDADQAPGSVTRLLDRLGDGDEAVRDAIVERVYAELRDRARARLNGRRDIDLAPTALVNQAVGRLIERGRFAARNREHLFRLFGAVMHALVCDAERAHYSRKRGGRLRHEPLDDPPAAEPVDGPDLEALDRALEALERHDPHAALVVRHRTFGHLTVEETAARIRRSPRHVKAQWAFACVWLRDWLEARGHGPRRADGRR